MISNFKKSKWTNTLLALILIIFVGLIGLTGSKLSANSDSNNNSAALSNPNSGTENKDNSAATTAPALETSKEVFYGQWVINQVLAYGSAGTYSKEDAESLLSKSLSFSEGKASFFGDEPSVITNVAANPVYKKSVISKVDFIINYRMTLDKLGIKADSVEEITVSDSKGTVCIFLIKDDNTLIIMGGGTYFELVRKAP